MELYLEEHISNSIRRVLRDTHCDIYGFGNLLRMYHPQDWQELEPRFGQVLENLPFTVTVNISLTGDPRFTEPIAPAGEEDAS